MSDVLVVGAGPTGLTLACELARRGIQVRIIDRARGPQRGSRAKTLNPRSQEVLADLGVGAEIAEAGIAHLRYRKYFDGEVVSELDPFAEPGPTPDAPYDGLVFLPEWRLEQILRNLLADHGVSVQWQTELAGLSQTSDTVTGQLTDGTTMRCRYLVGCDSARSTVRKLLGVGFAGETAEEQSMIVGDVEVDGLDRDVWHQWFDRDGAVLLSPFRGWNSWQIQANVERDDDGNPVEPSLQSFQRQFDRRARLPGVRLRNLTWSSTWRVNVRMAERYRVGNVFLAGDAAHVHPIAGGLGMNTGIQDAGNLGWKLALATAGRGGTRLLDTYQEERLPIAAWTLNLTSRLFSAVEEALTTPGVGLEKVVTDEGRGLGIHYRWSSLAHGQTGGTLQPGDRAPDAPCHRPGGTPLRLFETFAGTHFTLLGFGAGTRAAVRRITADTDTDIRAHVLDDDLIDTDGHARKAYATSDESLVLIRPDNHVAAITDQHDTIHHYLSQLRH